MTPLLSFRVAFAVFAVVLNRTSAFVSKVPLRSSCGSLASAGSAACRFGRASQTWGLSNKQRMRYSVIARGRNRTAQRAAGGSAVCMAQETLILTEENVIAVLEEAKQELGTLFGNSAENKEVGITGDVEFVGLDGPSVIVRFTGRFWHAKTAVLARVANFVLTRIPECVDVEIEDPSQLEDADPTGRGQGAEL